MKPVIKLALCAVFAAVTLGGCERPKSQEAAKTDKKSEAPAVAQTSELKAAEGSKVLNGVATILNPDALLQIDADLRSASIAAGFSSGTADRYKSAKSLSRQSTENAARQAGTDATQVKLLETRLKHTWGDDAPFLDADAREKLIAELSAGRQALVRLDFPDTSLLKPRNIRVAPLSGGEGSPVNTFWVAPTGNMSMPGVSYFGLIDPGPGLRLGDRARLTADGSEASTGVIIPSAAIVIFAGATWCFVEIAPKKYERRAVALDLPFADGYLVKQGFMPGTRVVVRGASLLLAREAEPGDDGDDNDDAKKPSKTLDDDKPAAAGARSTSQHELDPAAKDAHGTKDQAERKKPAKDTKAASSTDKDPD